MYEAMWLSLVEDTGAAGYDMFHWCDSCLFKPCPVITQGHPCHGSIYVVTPVSSNHKCFPFRECCTAKYNMVCLSLSTALWVLHALVLEAGYAGTDLESGAKLDVHGCHQMVLLQQQQCLAVDLLGEELLRIGGAARQRLDELIHLHHLHITPARTHMATWNI